MLTTPDYIIIAAYMLLSLGIGLALRKRASASFEGFVLGNRQLPWWLAGISMVATTFAADTPLAVNEIVYNNGVSGNWVWWSSLIGGMMTVFFFARLWRRSGVTTEAELIELRYGGKPAKGLRVFKAVYLGLFMNLIILGWVNLAMATVLQSFLGLGQTEAILYTGTAMLITGAYSSISGFLGVVYTDLVQFVIAMGGCIVLAYLVLHSPEVGGTDGLAAKLPKGSLNFFPDFSGGMNGKQLGISLASFIAMTGMVWWASWYPGAEPGGGGYIAQRMLSTKNEKHSLLATLMFQIIHYSIRPWPWIIVGLCAVVIYPGLEAENARFGYVYAMRDYLGPGLRGLLVVAFLGAYMSTISTQLNWGTSYLVNDVYGRFVLKPGDADREKKMVWLSRLFTFLMALLSLGITFYLNSIKDAWVFILQCGAGLGLVLMLRWFWWRINAWSEIAATVAPAVFYSLCLAMGGKWAEPLDKDPSGFILTVLGTTVTWIAITLFTRPEKKEILQEFYEKVRPGGWWKPFAGEQHNQQRNQFYWLLFAVVMSVILTYCTLFMTGSVIFGDWRNVVLFAAGGLTALSGLVMASRKGGVFN